MPITCSTGCAGRDCMSVRLSGSLAGTLGVAAKIPCGSTSGNAGDRVLTSPHKTRGRADARVTRMSAFGGRLVALCVRSMKIQASRPIANGQRDDLSRIAEGHETEVSKRVEIDEHREGAKCRRNSGRFLAKPRVEPCLEAGRHRIDRSGADFPRSCARDHCAMTIS